MVADDAVLVKQYRQQLEGMGSPLIRHHMEVRGLGLINIRDLFGVASTRTSKLAPSGALTWITSLANFGE